MNVYKPLVITQSSLGAALTVSWQRFVGTMLGTVVGAIVASQFGPRVIVFSTCVFILGLLRAVAHLSSNLHIGLLKCPSELG